MQIIRDSYELYGHEYIEENITKAELEQVLAHRKAKLNNNLKKGVN